MNLNILAYIIYTAITLYIIFWVGRTFYVNGRMFILRLFQNNAEQTDATNNIILIAYYLFNIGYAILQFQTWDNVQTVSKLISSIAGKTGLLVAILALTHYFNMLLIFLLSRRTKNRFLTAKK
ncbi:MAG: hypothetical protein KIT80_18975 [Chitinophagaceae bacterium]|nr:hypothetical protein [Chitinophagaceae bacterium]MCW5929010.1 hypothetical protein [Chitinophagaceae bacterium]